MSIYLRLILFLSLISSGGNILAQITNSYWEDVSITQSLKKSLKVQTLPKQYRLLNLEHKILFKILYKNSKSTNTTSNAIDLTIPMPNGKNQVFHIVSSSIMASELAKKFPDIQSFKGIAKNDNTQRIYLDISPRGFRAMILSPTGTIYIDPIDKDHTDYYMSYYKKNMVRQATASWSCKQHTLPLDKKETAIDPIFIPKQSNEKSIATVSLKKYRIAIAATGEYTAKFGGTVVGALSAINTTLNRVRGIYETEVAVTFELVANNDQIIYTNKNDDPYSNNNGSAMLTQNTRTLNDIIGSTNYDIGHVLSTGGGGIAGLGVVCGSFKAEGVTGSSNPQGDSFDVDFVAHEIGHQFGGNHTFNSVSNGCQDNRANRAAYEPGSGSTIQAYAGLCSPQNIQNNSDDYFHLISLQEIQAHITGDANSCADITPNVNTLPVINDDINDIDGKFIPANTPFELTASASDPDGDELTYNWEQWDRGAAGNINANSTNQPTFRSFKPNGSATRVLPQLSDILNNEKTYGEVLSNVSRALRFQFIVRDNNINGGAFAHEMVTIQVVKTANAFAITNHNESATLSGTINLNWEVGETDASPINCETVDIFLSTDGGNSFLIPLAENVPNDGLQAVVFPNISTSEARIKVKCSDNIFFDINDANLTIEANNSTCAISSIVTNNQTSCDNDLYDQTLTVTYVDAPLNSQLNINGQLFDVTQSPQIVTLTNLIADGQSVDIQANFTTDIGCSFSESELFTAPQACKPPCEITDISIGAQSSCNTDDNTYKQTLTIYYENPPAKAQLNINEQLFDVTQSPQIVTLTNLASDGLAVDVTASFLQASNCTYNLDNAFTAPEVCVQGDCESDFIDSGGINANYKNNEDIVYTFCPNNATTQYVSVTFSNYNIEGDDDFGCFDYLEIRDGNSYQNSILMAYVCGNSSSPETYAATNESGCLTIRFYSDFSIRKRGWEATVNCITKPNDDDNLCTIQDLTKDEMIIENGTYQAQQIRSTGTITNGSTVFFEASNTITLLPNFHAESGSAFVAAISPCETNSNTPIKDSILKKQSVKKTDIQPSMAIYPNPTQQTAMLTYNTPSPGIFQFTITDMNGKIMNTWSIATEEGIYNKKLDTSTYPNGIYFIALQGLNQYIVKRLAVLR